MFLTKRKAIYKGEYPWKYGGNSLSAFKEMDLGILIP
jgi:hypothetical protein